MTSNEQDIRIIPHHAWKKRHKYKILYPAGPGRGMEPERDANGRTKLFDTFGQALNFLVQNGMISRYGVIKGE